MERQLGVAGRFLLVTSAGHHISSITPKTQSRGNAGMTHSRPSASGIKESLQQINADFYLETVSKMGFERARLQSLRKNSILAPCFEGARLQLCR